MNREAEDRFFHRGFDNTEQPVASLEAATR
jgi:hypothetical protein